MAGARFVVAGGALLLILRGRGLGEVRPRHILACTFIGGLMLLGGNGGVVWAEQHVPSGITALPVATVPLWTVLLDSLLRRRRPSVRVMGGVFLGLAGLAVLANPSGADRVDPKGILVLVLASLSWATGSVLSRRAELPASPLLAAALEMICGGVLLLVASVAAGHASAFRLALVTPRGALALVYLVVFGSLVGMTSYVWLLHEVAPARAVTYAYVNPVIAMLLGWLFAGEPLTLRAILATAVIVAAVVLITTERSPAEARRGA
jgi:drug/metabolite transporter (DMT)-like permease